MKVIERASPSLSVREQVAARLSARTFDLQLASLFAMALWLGIAGEKALHLPHLLNALASILPVLALMMIADAVIHTLFGTTLGRWGRGVSITTAKGHPLNLKQHLRRNGAIWLRSLGCFFLPITIYTFYAHCTRLMAGQPSSHDAKNGYQITVKPVSATRSHTFSIALLLTSLIIIFLVSLTVQKITHLYL